MFEDIVKSVRGKEEGKLQISQINVCLSLEIRLTWGWWL